MEASDAMRKITAKNSVRSSLDCSRRRSKKDNFWDRKLVNNNPFDAHLRLERAFLDTGGATYIPIIKGKLGIHLKGRSHKNSTIDGM